MRISLLGLISALLLAVSLGAMPAEQARAGSFLGGGLTNGLPHQSPVQPALVWRDCQRIARCNGCKPVFRCRSCTYQRQCSSRRRPCEWVDVCVWGPYLPVAPRGVRVY
jgi:hypothetical protein